MKSLFASRTFWLAIVQAVTGTLIELLTSDHLLSVVGIMMIVKSVIDVILRLLTTEEVTL